MIFSNWIEHYLNVPVYFKYSKNDFEELASSYDAFIIICDENTERECLHLLKSEIGLTEPLKIITINSGEKNKSLQSAEFIWSHLLKLNATKNYLVIALGGGVICDLVGFTAATFKRGIDFVFFPTTLLAMVDAAIGGKNGFDFLNHKNMIGLIRQPKAIFIDTQFLKTLEPIELKNGFAESLKHALISDANYFNEINFENATDIASISKSALVKMSIVEEDINEKNIRKALNAGHTIAHAIESYSLSKDKNPISHGYAVALGLYCEAYISLKKGMLPTNEFQLIYTKIKFYFEKYVFTFQDIESIILYMYNDKKNDSKIRFSLLDGIGNVRIDETASLDLVRESLENYINHY